MALEFPVIFLLQGHLGSEEQEKLEDEIPTLTYDINEAEVIIGNLSRKQRALFELRKHKLVTEEVVRDEKRKETASPSPKKRRRTEEPLSPASSTRSSKRAKRSVKSLDSDDSTTDSSDGELYEFHSQTSPSTFPSTIKTVKVAKLSWFTDSLDAGEVLPLDDKYLVYEGRKPHQTTMKPPPMPTPKAADVLKRAMADADSRPKYSSQGHGHHSHGAKKGEHTRFQMSAKPPALIHETTSEHEVELPPIPDFLHTTYSCQRPTPVNPPNERFINELLKIRTARTLVGDKIGVRAYSSAIATLAAYPYPLSSTLEVARLPGCGLKIAQLYKEFRETGELQEAKEDESDPRLAVLKQFYDIWGVGETTAREFYNRGWRDLDDIVEYGWDSLSRVQQIGVKYYDEFLLKIPRDEVKSISDIILRYANKITKGGGFQMVIVGGYRRGKLESGDVDVVLSHPDENVTRNFVERIVVALEADGYITHTLTLNSTNSERGQVPVAWKGNESKGGTGFDTLDKALVVWQDPHYNKKKHGKNPNPHRRVDIIISPWKTAGCAVLGWTSGTTFQRDMRRYCKKEKGLKFDSSGIRSRTDGHWVDLESGKDGEPAPDMLTAERRVFEGLGLEWRPPEERCTG